MIQSFLHHSPTLLAMYYIISILFFMLLSYISFSSTFTDKTSFLNSNTVTDCLAHVVYSECRNTCSRQCFHFHSSFRRDVTLARNDGCIFLKHNIQLYLFQRQGMAQGNQVTCSSTNRRIE